MLWSVVMLIILFLGSSKWPKSSHEGSLLQPRLIDGNTGATPLLPRRWSGSESSINSELDNTDREPMMSSTMNNSYRQSLNSCTLDPDSFTFNSVTHSGKYCLIWYGKILKLLGKLR